MDIPVTCRIFSDNSENTYLDISTNKNDQEVMTGIIERHIDMK